MDLHYQEGIRLRADLEAGCVTSLQCGGTELVAEKAPLFRLRLMDSTGAFFVTDAFAASRCAAEGGQAVYSGFPYDIEVTVQVEDGDSPMWRIAVKNRTDMLVEWVDFPVVTLKPLTKNGGNAKALLPYNEGLLVDDAVKRQESVFCDCVPEYPSQGSYCLFPNMMCSQFLCYLFDGKGIYMGAHDEERGPKGIHLHPEGAGVSLYFKLYCGGNFGADYASGFPVVWRGFRGDWQDGAELYRTWFQEHLPPEVRKVEENDTLPAWYRQSPLIISYPVRGIHDMDRMEPNALFPYRNALPLVDEIAARTESPLMVLLMHWEGSAPWAPPYVWPPYGGQEEFDAFADALHDRGHTLGVYCSGFGYTLQSNLIEEYNMAKAYQERGLEGAMCASPAGETELSRICTAQRSGYDLCLGSALAQEVLDEAYAPLFKSKADYVQILDQNHGGGQYFCYSRRHAHPPAPGSWMTREMRALLKKWRAQGGKRLFGCESAAAEPFIGSLLFSDSRYELNWHTGEPVPLFSYLYHEYLRNFMGNQVSCGLSAQEDTLRLRMAYSFAAGDCMTLVLTPDGRFMSHWGNHDFSVMPDREKALDFAANMQRFYREQAMPYLYGGRMVKPLSYECGVREYPTVFSGPALAPDCISTAWEYAGARVQIFVNHTDREQRVVFQGETLDIPPLQAVMRRL